MDTHWTVYILYSTQYHRHYIGVTSNIEQRITMHNKRKVKSTKPYIPWKVIYSEEYEDKHEAYKREYYLKSPAGYLEKKKITDTLHKQYGEIA